MQFQLTPDRIGIRWRRPGHDLGRRDIITARDGGLAVFILWCGESTMPEQRLGDARRRRHDYLDCCWVCRRGLSDGLIQCTLTVQLCHRLTSFDRWRACEGKVKLWMCFKMPYYLWCGCLLWLCVLICGQTRPLAPAPALLKEPEWQAYLFQQLWLLTWSSDAF